MGIERLATPGGKSAQKNHVIPVPTWCCPRAAGLLPCDAKRRHARLREPVLIKLKEKFSVRDLNRRFQDTGERSSRPVVFKLCFLAEPFL